LVPSPEGPPRGTVGVITKMRVKIEICGLAVAASSPADEDTLLRGAAGQAVANRPPDEVNQLMVVVEDFTEESLPAGAQRRAP